MTDPANISKGVQLPPKFVGRLRVQEILSVFHLMYEVSSPEVSSAPEGMAAAVALIDALMRCLDQQAVSVAVVVLFSIISKLAEDAEASVAAAQTTMKHPDAAAN